MVFGPGHHQRAEGEAVSAGKTPATFTVGGSWGDAINFSSWKDKLHGIACVVGWKSPLPADGDVLRMPMVSGKTLLLRFVNVASCWDPHDMFFADAVAIGYEGETELTALSPRKLKKLAKKTAKL